MAVIRRGRCRNLGSIELARVPRQLYHGQAKVTLEFFREQDPGPEEGHASEPCVLVCLTVAGAKWGPREQVFLQWGPQKYPVRSRRGSKRPFFYYNDLGQKMILK